MTTHNNDNAEIFASPLSIYSELVGDLNNGAALEMIKEERQATFNRYRNGKESSTQSFEDTIKDFRLVLAYDILIESFQKYLNHER